MSLWSSAEDREYRRLITYVGLPDLVIVRMIGETFERHLRNAILDIVFRKLETEQDALEMTAADVQRPLDELIVRMRELGYDEQHRDFTRRGFSMIAATTVRRLPNENPRAALYERTDALLAHWSKRGLTAVPSSIDREARDHVIRKTESKSAFRRRLVFEVRTWAAMRATESGRRKDGTLTKRQRDRMRSTITQETDRIWP